VVVQGGSGQLAGLPDRDRGRLCSTAPNAGPLKAGPQVVRVHHGGEVDARRSSCARLPGRGPMRACASGARPAGVLYFFTWKLLMPRGFAVYFPFTMGHTRHTWMAPGVSRPAGTRTELVVGKTESTFTRRLPLSRKTWTL
jgi:hypothetical protein